MYIGEFYKLNIGLGKACAQKNKTIHQKTFKLSPQADSKTKSTLNELDKNCANTEMVCKVRLYYF